MNVIIFHGTGETTESFWYPYLREHLERRGYAVLVPQLPHPENPILADSLASVLSLPYSEDTVLIGHSSGAPLILSVLERITTRVHQAILVAGFFEPLGSGSPEPILQASYDWERIRAQCDEFVFINSDNDPWGCTDRVGRALLDHLGGTLIVPKGEGHMGSDSYNQPYREFPLLLKLIG